MANKRIRKKKATRVSFNKKQLSNLSKVIPNVNQLKNNFQYWDWEYLIELPYYIDNSISKDVLIHIGDNIDEVSWKGSPSIRFNSFKKSLTPYFKILEQFSSEQLLAYALVLKYCGSCYMTAYVSVDDQKVGKQLYKAYHLLLVGKLKDFEKYVLEDYRFLGWWN